MKFLTGPAPFIGILLLSAAMTIPAFAEISITTCPFNITTPGNYAVNADLTCSGDAIDISASQVTIKLNGHTITGPKDPPLTGSTVGVNINPNGVGSGARVDHVAITGPGLIQGFANGISISNADYSQVGLVTVAHNSRDGIAGLSSSVTSYITIASNVIVANARFGLALVTSSNSTVAYNDMSGNGVGGAAISGNAITVNNNTANANGDYGIGTGGNNSRLYSNVTNGNERTGIAIFTIGGGHQIFNNSSAVGNGLFDLFDDNDLCGTDFWSNNVFFTRNLPCVH